MTSTRIRGVLATLTAMLAMTGAFAAQANAHAKIGPSVVGVGSSNAYTLMVPTESETATTTSVVMEVPDGFNLGGFEATPGIKRDVVSTGSGEEAKVSKVTWTGLKVPSGESAFLRFSGYVTDDKPHEFAFKVEQTYSDGKVVDWAGAPEADEPAPTLSMVSANSSASDGTDTLTIVALVLGALALLIAIASVARRTGRSLT